MTLVARQAHQIALARVNEARGYAEMDAACEEWLAMRHQFHTQEAEMALGCSASTTAPSLSTHRPNPKADPVRED